MKLRGGGGDGAARPASDEPKDLGFGSFVGRESRQRLLNRDGSFNVERTGLPLGASLSVYQALMTMSWPRFLSLVGLTYLFLNTVFAGAYVLCGPDALQGDVRGGYDRGFTRAFFFSVQTFSTIGYGHLSPSGLAANLLVTVEALFGLMVFSLVTGILFARFARPTARLLFSDVAVVAPYQGGTAFEFRLANARKSQLIEVEAQVLLSLRQGPDRVRKYYPLSLERTKVMFFPLAWTVVHPIDEASPFRGHDAASLSEAGAEVMVLLSGIDDTFGTTVHTRTSYAANEIVWGARFASVFNRLEGGGTVSIDVSRLNEIERI